MAKPGTFLYFGYGSNLLKERLQILNPTAEFVSAGKLKDYKLDFNYSSTRWHGSPATITAAAGDHLWGCVWRMSLKDLPNIDKQEGVADRIYRPIEVNVITYNTDSSSETHQCRSYQLLRLEEVNPKPSPYYMDILIRGALQNNLPQDYIQKLRNIETNGYDGECKMYEEVLKSLQ